MKTRILLLPFFCLLLMQGCSIFDSGDTLIEIEGESYPLLDTFTLDSSAIISREYVADGDILIPTVKNYLEIKRAMEGHDYVIITRDSLLDFSLKLLAYRTINQNDIVQNGCIVVLDDIMKYQDTHELGLKNFLKSVENYIDQANNCYFVLVGSTDPFNGIPLPAAESGDMEYFPLHENIIHGRIPIENNKEGYEYLTKVITTEVLLSKSAVHVVDDNWQGDHKSPVSFDDAAKRVDSVLSRENWNKKNVFFEDFAHDTLWEDSTIKGPLNENERATVTKEIINALNDQYGFSIFNLFFSNDTWSDEKIIDETILSSLNTNSVYFPTARAYNMATGERTLVEKMLLAKYGAVAVICNSHTMSYVDSHSMLNKGLLENVSNARSLGELFQMAKKEANSGRYDRYTIVGDPAFSLHNLQ